MSGFVAVMYRKVRHNDDHPVACQDAKPSRAATAAHTESPTLLLALPPPLRREHLIIRLIIQTIRRDRSGSVWIDDPSNLSRPDPSGPDQIDVEHQATDLAFSAWLRLFVLDYGTWPARLVY
jgi:hypothetical protein